jgi:hypothetical protein
MVFSAVGRLRFIQLREVWTLGSPGPRECNRFPLNASFRDVQLSMNIYCSTSITYTVVPPYPLIQHPRFQLSAVYRGPPKNWKIK